MDSDLESADRYGSSDRRPGPDRMHAVNGNEDTGTASLTERRQRLGLTRNSTATRVTRWLPDSTSNETYARVTVEGLSMLLRRKGVSNPGHKEQDAYILQHQLAAGEHARWISLANADEKILDVALNVLELGATDARTGPMPVSCPPPMQVAFFAACCELLRNFLTERGPATTGSNSDRSVGSSSARAAVSTGNDAAEPPAPPAAGWPGR